MINTSLSNWI